MTRTTPGRRISSAAVNAPRLIMSWEDWLTLAAAFVTFLSVSVSIQQAHWVKDMPPLVPTTIAGLVIGLFAARIRVNALLIQPLALIVGATVVVLAAQSYADGAAINDRLADFRLRMVEWWNVVRSGDISNDNLPFVTLVQAVTWLSAYLASWSLYRWRNAWVAIIPAGFVLLSNISFQKGHPSEAFVVYLFGSILLVSRLHLQSSQARWKKNNVEYPEFVSLTAMNFAVIVAAALLVGGWLIPLGTQAKAAETAFDTLVSPATSKSEHFVRLFHNIDSRKGAQLHTFGDTLPIQGNIKLGTKVLLEVKSGEGGLVRATSYDEYTGNGWKATDRTTRRVDGGEVAPGEETAGGFEGRAVTVLNVKVVSPESTILTPGVPLGANLDTYIDGPKASNTEIERMRSRRGLENEDAYNAIGSESRATEEQLRTAAAEYPDWVGSRYLQLPKSLPKRVGEEALRVAAGAATPYDRAVAIQDYLRTLPYDLQVESPPAGRDVVDFLLFDLKRGYFDYQATAMAVMLRTLGVPSRVAVGYVLDPSEAQETRYTVRKDDAYAWVEVFFPGFGWVNFNPTQDKPAGGAGGLGSVGGAGSADLLDPSILDDLFANPTADSDIKDALEEAPSLPDGGRQIPWVLVAILAGILGILAATGVGVRVAWNWGLSGLDGRAQLWEKTQRLAGWAGLGSRMHETPREWSGRLGSAVGREPEADLLSRSYEEARYGRPDLTRIDEEETRLSYQRLRNTLAGIIFRRRPPTSKD